MSLYRNIFKDSIKITWKNKYFWLLGVFTVFFSTSVEIDMFDNFFGPNRNYLYNYKAILGGNFFKGGLFEAIKNWIQVDAAFFYHMLFIGLVFLLIFLVLLLVASIAQIIITDRGAAILKTSPETGKIAKKINLIAVFQQIKGLIVPISVVNLVLKIFINIALVLIVLPMIISNSANLTWLNVVLFIVLFPVAIVVAFIIRYVTCFMIIQGQKFKQAWKNGLVMFKNNWLVSVEMSLSLFLINILGSLAIIFIILAIANPVWFIGILVNQYIYKGGFYIILAISYLLFFALFALGASWLAVFNIVSWTNLFLKLNKGAADSKIVRVFNDLVKKQ